LTLSFEDIFLHHISGSISKFKTIPIGTMYIKAFWDLSWIFYV